MYVCVCFVSHQIGCDRSSALVQICEDRSFQAFVSDALSLPLRSASFDACISIAVIHHFSTQVQILVKPPTGFSGFLDGLLISWVECFDLKLLCTLVSVAGAAAGSSSGAGETPEAGWSCADLRVGL